MIIRSMSLADWSVALATEPYTKAARIADDNSGSIVTCVLCSAASPFSSQAVFTSVGGHFCG